MNDQPTERDLSKRIGSLMGYAIGFGVILLCVYAVYATVLIPH